MPYDLMLMEGVCSTQMLCFCCFLTLMLYPNLSLYGGESNHSLMTWMYWHHVSTIYHSNGGSVELNHYYTHSKQSSFTNRSHTPLLQMKQSHYSSSPTPPQASSSPDMLRKAGRQLLVTSKQPFLMDLSYFCGR